VNPEPILQLDRVIHERVRLAVMAMLAANPDLSFTELRDALQLTDGNLTSHIRTLQESGYIAVTKAFQDARPLTTLALTETGRAAFVAHIDRLESIVRQSRPNPDRKPRGE